MTDWNPSAWGCNKSDLKLVKRTTDTDATGRRTANQPLRAGERHD